MILATRNSKTMSEHIDGATAPVLKVCYNTSMLSLCFNFIVGKPIRYIEFIPEVMYYMTYFHNKEDYSTAVNNINKTIKETTNVQITELEFLEMRDRLFNDYYYNECINLTRTKIDYIV